MSKWYILYNNQQIGPMTRENLMAYNPSPSSMIWCEGMPQWQPLYTIPELMEMLNGTMHQSHHVNPTPGVVPPGMPLNQASYKNKTTAGILAILLGGLGIQYFYLGKVWAGILTIVISLISCGIWPILMLIQGILMLTMTQEEFDRKFVYNQNFFPLF